MEFAAVLVNRIDVGHDGKTQYERLRGKQSGLLGLQFGEPPAPGKLLEMDVSWEDGSFFRYRTLSRETIVTWKKCDADDDSQREASRGKMVG